MKVIYGEFSPSGHYAPGMISNGMLYISGQTSTDPDTGKPAAGGVAAETLFALKKIDNILKQAGCARSDVVMCRLYMPDIAYWSEANRAYGEFFKDHRPARIAIPTGALSKGCLIEIEAIAEIKK